MEEVELNRSEVRSQSMKLSGHSILWHFYREYITVFELTKIYHHFVPF